MAKIGLMRALPPEQSVLGVKLGRLVGWDNDHGYLIDYAGNSAGPRTAASLVALDGADRRRALDEGRRVLLAFTDDDTPVILGFVQQSPIEAREVSAPTGEAVESGAEGPPREVMVDGKRVVLEAADEIELRCGQASITLRRNGRVVIQGVYVETHAQGVNRIKGGSVSIN